ncbi:E3 ubiquitin-protein ligase KCMF1-like isoform X2 [Harmonia axyridis]|uniref:E3 ubiquitin-protein ligase KCMF1-like isoform X2 n=1 Tax=Harmonia axyridis TaxID=115357 RepID=UPI001E276ACE|nr:E3 ubiquitin-protein ligase KCMF1-like isoform X2 [Harmonia axyridis]
MSRHEGVSCDSCLKGNFRGRRYKCLICYDYDLCSACYEAGATNTRHTTDHPMQCILTRADFELYYGGEALSNVDMPQSYTCPYCCRMGFTEITLQEHVTAEHAENSFEVVCPLCAAIPGGEPNLMTDDFAGHLTLEHRTGPRDLISFLDEPVANRHNMRRIPHPSHSGSHIGRGSGTLRPRRSNMHFSVFNSSGGLPSLSPSSRESVDPIAELLSQLSGVRRSAERQQVNAARQQLDRYPRRLTQSQNALREPQASSSSGTCTLMLHSTPVLVQPTPTATATVTPSSQFLLSGLLEELSLQQNNEQARQDRSQFVQELVMSTFWLPESNQNETSEHGPSGDSSNASQNFGLRRFTPTLRGRARSDIHNAKRRAEANKSKNDHGEDNSGR